MKKNIYKSLSTQSNLLKVVHNIALMHISKVWKFGGNILFGSGDIFVQIQILGEK